ncbi:MAG: hypothetical protein JWR52_2657 [Marmoricola sp.]|nr:hypothetical protein [Marmoricola sp.]
MSGPTLWEEGRWPGSRVTRFSVFACVLLAGLDLAVLGHLERLFDSGFILLCVAMALVIRPSDFVVVGVLPPMLLLAVSTLLGIVDRRAVAPHGDGLIQAVISGLAHHSGPLMAGYLLALAVLGIRTRVIRRHRRQAGAGYSNLEVSPAPYRVISGEPEVKSTTVVGSEPHSPESITASST